MKSIEKLEEINQTLQSLIESIKTTKNPHQASATLFLKKAMENVNSASKEMKIVLRQKETQIKNCTHCGGYGYQLIGPGNREDCSYCCSELEEVVEI